MRASSVWHSALRRLGNPTYWGLVLILGAMGVLVPWSLGLGIRGHHLLLVLAPLYWSLVCLMVLPMAWQWSGGARNLASLPRGLAQAIAWTVLWALPMVAASDLAHRLRAPHPGPAPTELMEARTNPKPVLGVLSYMLLGLLVSWLMAHKEEAEEAAGTARRIAAETRMHLLQSQMNPHVLFNSISALAEMVREDPGAAEEILLGLSGFLRDLLDYGHLDLAPLARERAMTERYLALETLRLGPRLKVSWDWDETLEQLELPPLTLQPLVENAIKHGISPCRTGGELHIRLFQKDACTCLEVANTGMPLAENRIEGIGLRNLRERLAHILPDASFTLVGTQGWTRATLRLEGRP
nr:histidine kinase [uncultured Holophaga sp.]